MAKVTQIKWTYFKDGSPDYDETILITSKNMEGIISGVLKKYEDTVTFIPHELGPDYTINWDRLDEEYMWARKADIGTITK